MGGLLLGRRVWGGEWGCIAPLAPTHPELIHSTGKRTSLSLSSLSPSSSSPSSSSLQKQARLKTSTTQDEHHSRRAPLKTSTKITEKMTTPWAGRIHPNAAGHFFWGGDSVGRGPGGLSPSRCFAVAVATRPTWRPGPLQHPSLGARRTPRPPGPRAGCPSPRIGPRPRGGIHSPPRSPDP